MDGGGKLQSNQTKWGQQKHINTPQYNINNKHQLQVHKHKKTWNISKGGTKWSAYGNTRKKKIC